MSSQVRPLARGQLWLSIAQASHYMGISESTIRKLIDEKQLRASYFSSDKRRCLRISTIDIDDFASKNATFN